MKRRLPEAAQSAVPDVAASQGTRTGRRFECLGRVRRAPAAWLVVAAAASLLVATEAGRGADPLSASPAALLAVAELAGPGSPDAVPLEPCDEGQATVLADRTPDPDAGVTTTTAGMRPVEGACDFRREGPPLAPEVAARQRDAFEAKGKKTVLDLQPFRRTSTIPVLAASGRRGIATLSGLNPRINEWYVLEVAWSDGSQESLHLENPRPAEQELVLDPAHPEGLGVRRADGTRICPLWSDRLASAVAAERSSEPFVRLCDGDVYARRKTRGSRTSKEAAADFLRRNFWGGEAIEVLVRDTVYSDAFLSRPRLAKEGRAALALPPSGPEFPRAARTRPDRAVNRLAPDDLGISREEPGPMAVGHWYPSAGEPGVFVSTLVPDDVAPEARAGNWPSLDSVERNAVVYLIAFDLDRFELGFELGTDHPDVGWSERTLASVRDDAMPGPDGIGSTDPVVPTGLLPPRAGERVVATFAGGFKRRHGAFRYGELARVNGGSHYGFVVAGTVLSKLQPGLATVFALDDGRIDLKTWTAGDDALLERVRFARQNGVAILERDPRTGEGVLGALVGRWSEGNWAGSKDSKLRSVRAAAGLQSAHGKRFLLYAYFSSATPGAMARVLGAYGCEYALHLDMNALEHTYLALYHAEAGKLAIEHLVRGMSVLEKTKGAVTVPRFLGYADNRDFFYVVRKPGAGVVAQVDPGPPGEVAPSGQP